MASDGILGLTRLAFVEKKQFSEAYVMAKKEEAIEQKDSNFNASEFLKGTKEELDKVVWPSRQQLVSESVAVILMVILSATIIYLTDKLFRWAAGQIF